MLINEVKPEITAIEKNFVEYLLKKDWRVKENANGSYSFPDFINHLGKSVIANVVIERPELLSFVLSDDDVDLLKEAVKNHKEGRWHIHDFGYFIGPYCNGMSLEHLITKGIPSVNGSTASAPAKHLSSLIHQMISYVGIIQQEFAGAQAFNSVDTYLAPYVKELCESIYDEIVDSLDLTGEYGCGDCTTDKNTIVDEKAWEKAKNSTKRRVKQYMQQLVHGVNVQSRWGQSPFLNLTFDLNPPGDLAIRPALVGGETRKYTYGELQEWMDVINEAFVAVLLDGDAEGKPFTFPIPTYNITPDFDWNSPIAKDIFVLTTKFGSPYFQNYIGTGRNPDTVRAMCCRLNLDLDEIYQKSGGTWGAGDNTGSVGVITVNLRHLLLELMELGYESYDGLLKAFEEQITTEVEAALAVIEVRRKLINYFYDAGLFPYSKKELGNKGFKFYFNTVGVIGGWEAADFLLSKLLDEKELPDDETAFKVERMKEMVTVAVNTAKRFQKECGSLCNVEATPCESATYRFQKLDAKRFDGWVTENDYLSNSTMFPVELNLSLWDQLEHQSELQFLYTGGTMFHVFSGESSASIDTDNVRSLIQKVATNTKLPYFSFTPTFSVCPSHGYQIGEVPYCPKCGVKNAVYSRIVGYYRPTYSWNDGKKEEFERRKEFEREEY